MSATAIRLESRGVIAVSGEQRVAFLQGIVTNDVRRLGPERALYAALLTPQGKYLFDFFMIAESERILLDCEAARRDDLMRRLMLYRLRARVEITDVTGERAVWAILDAAPAGLPGEAGAAQRLAGGIVCRDPRTSEIGWRAILPADVVPAYPAGGTAQYEARRIALGLPDGSRDLEVGKTLALEADFDLLGAIDFDKGCYIGQEITARTKHRGKVRRRLLPIEVAGSEVPAPGMAVMAGETRVGEIRSVRGTSAIALLRLDDIAAAPALTLEGDGRPVRIRRPDWTQGLTLLDEIGPAA